DYNSKMLFGDYIHKYYYNASIADGYTLRLIREEIETSYKLILQKALDEIEVLQGDIDKKLVFSHIQYVKPLLDYIIHDFENSRIRFDDPSIGAMVVCDSSEQAKKLYEVFQEKQAEIISQSANNEPNRNSKYHVRIAALILHDVATKEDRKNWTEEFNEGKIDILFVYNMLLTGFDAKRLKKLYLGRLIKQHNLLQALTRVNRPYKSFRYGFVVDFADIRKEFDATNEAYFKELQAELGDELENYSRLFKSKEEIETEIAEIEDVLFRYDTTNAEIFSQQINQIQDRETILTLKKSLENAKSLYNLIRLMGNYELLEKADFQKLNLLYREASNRLDMLNLKQRLESGTESVNLLNAALVDVVFSFVKVGEEELILADELKNTLRRTIETIDHNFDQADPQFISLKEELERLFKQKKLNEVKQEEMNQNISSLNRIYEQIKELNRQNNLLKAKYGQDVKYVRIHKRLLESKKFAVTERKIYEALRGLKTKADDLILQNTNILNNESYFSQQMIRLLIDQFKNQQKIDINAEMSKYINSLIVKEYINEYNRGIA
ncbi:MAG: UvrB domain 3-containing protein, partial [Dolichospermum sp.]